MKHHLYFFGLGNPGKNYAKTKHNIGTIVLEQQALQLGTNFTTESEVLVIKQSAFTLLLSKNLFMNESGGALASFFRYHELPETSILILIQDDSDQEEGRVKMVVGGGTAGHRGIESVYQHALKFFLPLSIVRIKMGIRPKGLRGKSENFVLGSVSELDLQLAHHVRKEVFSETGLNSLASGDFQFLMNRLNGVSII